MILDFEVYTKTDQKVLKINVITDKMKATTRENYDAITICSLDIL